METKKQYIKILIPCSVLLLMCGFSFLASGQENRHVVVDQAIGGMEQGRRISSPGSYNKKGITSGKSGSTTNPATDAHGHPLQVSGNHGYLYSSSVQASGSSQTQTGTEETTPSAAGTVQTVTGQVSGTVNTATPQTSGVVNVNTGGTASVETQGNGGVFIGGETTTGSGSSATTQEPSGTSSNPIVAVDANVNPSSGTPTTGVVVDTSGQLEERQIVDAGVTQETTGSLGAEVGSAADITGADLVEEADITTEPVSETTGQTVESPSNNHIIGVEAGTNPESGTPSVGVTLDTTGELEDRQILETDLLSESLGSSATQVGSASDITGSSTVQGTDVTTQPVTSTTGQTIPGTTEAQTGSSSSGTTTQESSGTSSNPIIGVEAGVNPESGTVDAGVAVDTSGQLEDRQILDAGVTGTGTSSSETQIGSASSITGSETVGGLDVTTQPVESIIPAPSDLSAEIDTSGQTVGGASDVGAQADLPQSSGRFVKVDFLNIPSALFPLKVF